jgi:hypothetical protein
MICSWLVVVAVFPVIGIVCTVVGAVQYRKISRTPWLLSVPLCPVESLPTADYVGNWIPDTGVCPSSPPLQFAIQFPVWLVQNPDTEQAVFLIHNLWNYDMNLTLCPGPCENSPFRADLSRSWGSSSSELREITEDGFLPSGFFDGGGKVRVYQPDSGGGLRSQRWDGEPCALRGLFEKIEIGTVKYSAVCECFERALVFTNLRATAADLIHPPQLYWGSWAKQQSMNGVLISGIVLLSFAGLVWVLSIVVVVALIIACNRQSIQAAEARRVRCARLGQARREGQTEVQSPTSEPKPLPA